MSDVTVNLENTHTKHAGGRPKDAVWVYFEHNATKFPGHFDAKCNFCSRYWKMGVVKKLQVHLARECNDIDNDTKHKYMLIVAKRDGLLDDTNIMEIIESDKDNLSTEQIAIIDRSVLKAFVMCGIPFRVIENPYFVNLLKNLNSNYEIPSRERLSNNLLDEEAIRIEIKIKNSLEKAKNLTLGMKLFRIIIIYNM